MGTDSFICSPGKPLLPIIDKVFTFPLGTEIVDIDVGCDYEKYVLSGNVKPCPEIKFNIIEFNQKSNNLELDEKIYSSSNFYPSKPYYVSRGAGLRFDEHVLF